MDRAAKTALVDQLNTAWKDSGVMVVAHYKGMTVAEMTEFRRRIKEAGGSVKVAKNKLAQLALKDTKAEGVAPSQGTDVHRVLGGSDQRSPRVRQVLQG